MPLGLSPSGVPERLQARGAGAAGEAIGRQAGTAVFLIRIRFHSDQGESCLMKIVRGCAMVSLAAAVLLSAGCGGSGSGPKRIPLSGKVTINGKPSPGGTVVIRPAEGSSGVGGSGVIINGEYEFTAANGPQPGKYVLVVNLADVAATPKNSRPIPKPGYESGGNPEGVQLPGDQCVFTYEIDVPAEGKVVKDVEIK